WKSAEFVNHSKNVLYLYHKFYYSFCLRCMKNKTSQSNQSSMPTEIERIQQELEKLQQAYNDLQERYKQAQDTIKKLSHSKTESLTTGTAHTKRFKMVTVLYANITGFQELEHVHDAQSVIDDLDSLFFEIDAIVERYNIKKIKSLGDTYMCAGGIPKKIEQILLKLCKLQWK